VNCWSNIKYIRMTCKTIFAWRNSCAAKKSFKRRRLDASIAITARWKVTCISKVGEQHVFTRNIGCHVNGFPTSYVLTFTAFHSPDQRCFWKELFAIIRNPASRDARVYVHFSIAFRWKSFLHSFMLATVIILCVYLAVKYSTF